MKNLRDTMFDPKQIEKLAKQMGIRTKQIDAKKVLIETDEGKMIIENPLIVEINMKGQRTFQISGSIKEISFNEEDINLVMEKANIDRDKAIKLLELTNGDVAEAILKSKRGD